MKNNSIYLFGLGLQKNIQVLTDKTIKFNDVLTIHNDYAIIVLSFNKEIQTNNDKETRIINILNEHQLSLYELNVEDFYQYESLLVDQEDKDVFFHCLHEYYRMNQIDELIQTNQYNKIARLMKDSYNSFKYYYQTTTQKQDYLMILTEQHHALGANISDNHLVCLVKDNKKQMFIKKMKESFKNTYGQPLISEVNHD
jgi:galactokinase